MFNRPFLLSGEILTSLPKIHVLSISNVRSMPILEVSLSVEMKEIILQKLLARITKVRSCRAECSSGTKLIWHPVFAKALILQNHGILTAGETIESAVAWFIMLERHCQVMLMSDAAAAARGQRPIPIDEDDAEFTHSKTGTELAGHFQATPYFSEAKANSNGAHLQ